VARHEAHFCPVEKPAPPRPRRPDFFTLSITSSEAISSACDSAAPGVNGAKNTEPV
jgi:hypothetical protein